MTKVALEDMGLPECPVIPWMKAVEAEGWEGGGLYEPTPGYVALWYNVERREFCLVADIVPEPLSYRIIRGSVTELLTWIEAERPELVGTDDHPGSAWRCLHDYAHNPESEHDWWKICDGCSDGSLGLAVDVGDA